MILALGKSLSLRFYLFFKEKDVQDILADKAFLLVSCNIKNAV